MPRLKRDERSAALLVGLCIGAAFGEVRRAKPNWREMETNLKTALKNIKIIVEGDG